MANVEVTLNQTLYNQSIFNVQNWQVPDTSFVTLQELANGIRASFDAVLTDWHTSNWTLEDISVRVFDGNEPFTTVIPFSAGPLVGTALSNAVAPENSCMVALSYVGVKPNRGRQYHGGMVEFAWEGNRWAADLITDFVAYYNALIAGVGTSAGTCILRIARKDYANNVWLLDNPVETAIPNIRNKTLDSRKAEDD